MVNEQRTLPQADPWRWSLLLALGFLALCWHRLGTPSGIYFDEVHYVKAARKLLALQSANPEHPMFGKEMIAGAMWLLGDKPLFWRVPSVLFGTLGFYAYGRMLWFLSRSRFATLAGQFLLLTGFNWFIQSRIAMLDMVMAGTAMVALWMMAAAMARPENSRWRLAVAGLCLGLALGAKWSIAPVAALPGLLFLVLKLRVAKGRFLTAREGGPVPGISLIEAGLWLGVLPVATYWATYLPNFFYVDHPISPWGFVEHHEYMLRLQDSVRRLHPYRSVWYQWMANWRTIWFLYREIDGAWRGILLVGNPFTMLAGLPAVLWCLWAGFFRQHRAALAMALCYVASLGFWAISTKPIQFYYHYLLPSAFLLACLALALDALWRLGGRWRWLVGLALAVSAGMFAWFYPIISAAPLAHGKKSFVHWMWLDSWR